MASELVPWGEPALLTADDLWRLSTDGTHLELVEGRLYRMSPIGLDHGLASNDLANALTNYVRQHALGSVISGEPGFIISSVGERDTVLAPDVAFVSTEQMPPKERRPKKGYPRLVPDLVVEVASPSQFRPELTAKAKQWLRAGVLTVWVVWPRAQQVDVWEAGAAAPRTLRDSDVLDGGLVLPGFTYPLSELWR